MSHIDCTVTVVVQKPHHVRITDFGLAKLLDSKHAEFKSQGGRVSDISNNDKLNQRCIVIESIA